MSLQIPRFGAEQQVRVENSSFGKEMEESVKEKDIFISLIDFIIREQLVF